MDRKPLRFSDLGLNNWLIRQCETIGVKTPTSIQENCIPKILAGSDCIGCAKTGSGKTLAFVLPILQKLREDPYGIFALVLTPTRELAYQIGEQFAVLGKMINLRHSVVTGGIEMIAQAQELSKKPHVVITTPERLADHLESCDTFSLKLIKFLVIDEADRLLGGRFNEQLKTIFAALPKQKQILMFSATLTDSIEQMKQIASKEVFVWKSDDDVATVDELNQYYVPCPSHARDGYLVEAVRSFTAKNATASIMIFTDTCKNSQLLSTALNEVGYENAALHGMITQKQRLAALAKFKSGTIKILIATDVASRGLDIPTVLLVINHIVPNDYKTYVHRVGRTARAGCGGTAISLVSQDEIGLVKSIEENIHCKLKEYNISVSSFEENGDQLDTCALHSSVDRSRIEERITEILSLFNRVKVMENNADVKVSEDAKKMNEYQYAHHSLQLENIDPSDQVSLDSLMKASKYGVDHIDEISCEYLKTIHKHLNPGCLEVGIFRSGPVWIQSTFKRFETTDAQEIVGEMEDLISLMRSISSADERRKILIAMKVSTDFVITHPFQDGNGRLSRILLSAILKKFGFPYIVIPVDDTIEYCGSLSIIRTTMDYTLIYEFLLKCIHDTLKSYLEKLIGN